MDLQFYGANCVSLSIKGTRIIIDDNLAALGAKSVTKAGDVALFTNTQITQPVAAVKLAIDMPGEYEVSDISIVGIPARAHLDAGGLASTMYKLTSGDMSVLVVGHIHPELSDKQLESIGMVDVMVVPVGGHGYTLDPLGALKIIKAVEPKLVVPVHYEDEALNYEVPQTDLKTALHELGMEPKETVTKLHPKPADLTDVTQLVVLEKV